MTCTIVHYQRNRASLYRGFGGAWWFGCGAFCFPLFSLFYYLLLWWPIFVIVTLTLVIYVCLFPCASDTDTVCRALWIVRILLTSVICSYFNQVHATKRQRYSYSFTRSFHDVSSWRTKVSRNSMSLPMSIISHTAPHSRWFYLWVYAAPVGFTSDDYHSNKLLYMIDVGIWRHSFVLWDVDIHLFSHLWSLSLSLSLSPHLAGWLRLYILYKKRQPIIHTR